MCDITKLGAVEGHLSLRAGIGCLKVILVYGLVLSPVEDHLDVWIDIGTFEDHLGIWIEIGVVEDHLNLWTGVGSS